MIIQYMRFPAFLAWTLLLNINASWALTTTPGCPKPTLEGMPWNEAQMQQIFAGNCRSCDCIRDNLIKSDLPSLDEHYKSELAELIRLRFEDSVIPNFIDKMRLYKESSARCSLDRAHNMKCGDGRLVQGVQKAYNTFLGRAESLKDENSCFPMSTIRRSLQQEKLEEDFGTIQMFDQRGMLESLSIDSYDPILKIFIENRSQFDSVPKNYNNLKEIVMSGPLKEQLSESLGPECDQFYDEMEELYCKQPNKLDTSDKSLSEFFGVDLRNEEFPLEASDKGLQLFTLKCAKASCTDKLEKDLCRADIGDQAYDVERYTSSESNLLRQSDKLVGIAQQSLELNEYCPLLSCQDPDEAMRVYRGEQSQCQQASPKKTLGKLIADLKCQKDNPHRLCNRDPLNKIFETYVPSDEALPIPETLLGGKSLEELDSEERREILRSYGHSDEDLEFLGDNGIKFAFGENLKIDAPKLSKEQLAFQELGAESARELEQERQEALQAEVEGKAVPENNRFAKAFNSKSKSARTVKAKNNQKPPQKQVRKNNQARAKRAFQANANNPNDYSRSLAQFSNDEFEPSSLDRLQRRDQQKDSNSGIKELTNRLKELRKQADRMKAEKDQSERKELEDRISELERNIADVSSSSRAERRRDRDESNTASVNPNRAFLPRDESERRIGQAAEENSENTESQERESESLGTIGPDNPANSSAQTGRSPASNPEASSALNAPEGTKYYEQESEQLPLFTLDSLDGLKPGEGFILGVREGADLKQVLMKPITSEQGTFYDSADLENLSPQARASLLESPFFQKYAHPELKIKLEESVRESKKHDDLIKLLGEQT